MKSIQLKKPIKIIAIMGSPRKGNTDTLVQQAIKGAEEMGAEVEYIKLRKLKIGDCVACEACAKNMKCKLKDDMQPLYQLLEEAQGIILGSPTYFYSVTGTVKCFLDRLYAYELFDTEDRHVWMGAMENGIRRFAVTIALGEQSNEKDLGATSVIMRDALSAIGYRSVANLSFTNMVYKNDAKDNKDALTEAEEAGKKLVKSCLLARRFYDNK
jgi:multimeric flavodoxin WrbA